jgi:hypothetical protein
LSSTTARPRPFCFWDSDSLSVTHSTSSSDTFRRSNFPCRFRCRNFQAKIRLTHFNNIVRQFNFWTHYLGNIRVYVIIEIAINQPVIHIIIIYIYILLQLY